MKKISAVKNYKSLQYYTKFRYYKYTISCYSIIKQGLKKIATCVEKVATLKKVQLALKTYRSSL